MIFSFNKKIAKPVGRQSKFLISNASAFRFGHGAFLVCLESLYEVSFQMVLYRK